LEWGSRQDIDKAVPVSSQIDAPDDLCVAVISLLERVLINKEAVPEAPQL